MENLIDDIVQVQACGFPNEGLTIDTVLVKICGFPVEEQKG